MIFQWICICECGGGIEIDEIRGWKGKEGEGRSFLVRFFFDSNDHCHHYHKTHFERKEGIQERVRYIC